MKPPQGEVLLFLDVDGVLNNTSDPTVSRQALDEGALWQLKALLEAVPDAKIILSSAWRLVAKMTRLLSQQLESFGIPSPVGATSVVGSSRVRLGETANLDKQIRMLAEQRANEILLAVKERRPRAWCAVDDLDLSPFIKDATFVRTDEKIGLDEAGRRAVVANFHEQLKRNDAAQAAEDGPWKV